MFGIWIGFKSRSSRTSVPLTPEQQEQRAIQQEQRAAMREAMNQLQQVAEQSLVKIIGTPAYGRLKQIQLQLQGPSALLQPEMIEKLNLSEEQVEQLQELMTGVTRPVANRAGPDST